MDDEKLQKFEFLLEIVLGIAIFTVFLAVLTG